MSVSPPPPSKSNIGDIWVDPFTAERYIFTGENLDKLMYGWVQWDLANEKFKYEIGQK